MKKVGKNDDKTVSMFGGEPSSSDADVDAADGFGDDVKSSSVKRPKTTSAPEFWQVRLHPFERYRGYGKKKNTETEALTYVTWLFEKTGKAGTSILLEKDGVVWALWTFEDGAWTEELQH